MIAFKLLAVVMATRLVHGLFLPNRGGAPLSRANQMMMMMKKTKIRGLTTFPNTDPRIRRSDRKCKTYRIGYYTDEYFEKWTDIPLGTVKGSKSLVSGYRFYDLKGYDAKTNKTVLFASESNVYLKNYTSEEIHRDGVDFEAMANGVLTFNDGTRLNQLYYQGECLPVSKKRVLS